MSENACAPDGTVQPNAASPALLVETQAARSLAARSFSIAGIGASSDFP